MMNVLGLSLDEALKLLKAEDMRVEVLQGRLPRKSTTESESAPREEQTRGTLRVVRQSETMLTVCRFNDTVMEECDEAVR